MRKKFIKSSRPTYKKRIKKAQQGMKFVSYNPVSNPTIDYTDITNPINPFSEYNYNTTYDKPEALVVPVRDTNETDVVANNPTVEPVINKSVASKVTYTPKSYKGLAAFNKAYDEVEASNPEAKKYRQFLTKMAEQESGFNSAIQNRAGAPAYGYFQFMQDDKKYNNIRQYAGTDIETFRNNPKLQIEAAIKLAKSFEKGFSKEDLELANKNGYSTWGLLGGAWLAGNGGVRKFLRGQGNPSDRHWSKEGKGTDVATRIKAFNFKEGGIVKYQEPAQPINRRDAIRDYRPNIPNRIRRAAPAEHIQSMINIYGQSEQPIVTSDAKSPWQHQQAHEAASKGYDDYMQAKKYEEGLHNLNGILTFTDYATLATGLGSLLSKGASMAGRYAGKQMAKRAVGKEFKRQSKHLATPANNSLLVDMSGVTPRPLSEFSSLSDAELAKLLPDYAHPNWQGDGFKLVKERLWNGGFDRLEKYGDISRYSPQQRTIILNSNPKIETSVRLGEQPGTGTYRETYSINKDVLRDYTLQQSSDVKAHEMVHYMYRPSKEQEAELAYNVRQYFKRPEGRDYFRKSRATEQTARGTQIKNYYGLNEGNQDITPAMWEYARRNYVKDTGINNNMTEWLNSVDERDISAFVKWLSNNAPVIAAPLIGGTMYGNKDSK